MKNSEYRIQNLAKVEMIHAGPGPLIMFLKDWVIRLTVVEDGHWAVWKQTGLLAKHFLNRSQKCETWPDPGPGHGFCPGGARTSGPAPKESHTLGLKGGLLQMWSGGKFPSWSALTSCCLPLDNRPLLFPSPKNFFNSPTSFGEQCVVADPSLKRHQRTILTSCMESRSLVSW